MSCTRAPLNLLVSAITHSMARFHARSFHSVDTAFGNAAVHDLLNLTLPIIWIVNNRCTAGQPSRVLVVGAVGKDFLGMWIKDHRFVTAFPDPILADNPAKENANDL